MAELSAGGKQPHYKPSRLKNQVSLESGDEDRTLEVVPVQAPDSQVVIPETQFDQNQEVGHALDNESDHGDVILSPKSAAILERNAVKKKNETIDTPFAVTLFTKDRISKENSTLPIASVGFSFGQPKRAAMSSQFEAMPSKVGVTTPQSVAEPSLVPKDIKGPLHQVANSECYLSSGESC
jgi:hypothetical protein